MRKYHLLFFLFALFSLCGYGQYSVRLGGSEFVPEANIASREHGVRGTRGSVDLGVATGGWHNVLVQFYRPVTPSVREDFERRGLRLEGYLGGQAYRALVREGVDVGREFANRGVRSVVGFSGAWKSVGGWTQAYGSVPQHARVGGGGVRVTLRYSGNVAPSSVSAELASQLGARGVELSEHFRVARLVVPHDRVAELLEIPWVVSVQPADRGQELLNRGGAVLSSALSVSRSAADGGRGLTGAGVRVGVWDGNVAEHPDFGNRVERLEYENATTVSHGTHVMGSILGAGMVDPDARGMAPGARGYAHNFNVQKNGWYEPYEMLRSQSLRGIHLTSNSYGVPFGCEEYADSVYGYSLFDQMTDQLAFETDLLHLFAAGNEQNFCPSLTEERYGTANYGSVTRRTKNAIIVGAVHADGTMSDFSSWGPMDDGRLAPTVCAKGVDVLSCSTEASYMVQEGTSMATPLTSGVVSLLFERYMQLHPGKVMPAALARAIVANTALDAGLPGPDFQYGFGIVDAERAVRTVERKQYDFIPVEPDKQGLIAEGEIAVPAGAKRIRVMIAWNDPVRNVAYEYGKPALHCDFDLVLNGNVKALFPDPAAVTEPAKPVGDRLNSMEQCVMEVSGTTPVRYEIRRQGALGEGEEVGLALTWSFDYAGREVLNPVAGEILEPGETYMIRTHELGAKPTFEISYDGNRYVTLPSEQAVAGSNEVETGIYKVVIPADAPLTRQARLRVIDASGVVMNPAPFGISPQVNGLVLKGSGSCSIADWTLEWEDLPGAAFGLAVLRGDPASGEFQIIGQVGNGSTSFTIPASERKVGAIYSVAPYYSEHEKVYGKRSIGVIAKGALAPLTVSTGEGEVVWRESFQKPYAGPISITKADSVRQSYYSGEALPEDFPLGSNVLILENRRKDNADFDRAAPFANEKYVSRLNLCGLDLSPYTGEELLVDFRVLLVGSGGRYPNIRVKLGDEVLKSVSGTEELTGLMWPDARYRVSVKADTPKDLKLEVAMGDYRSAVHVVGVTVRRAVTHPDVTLTLKEKILVSPKAPYKEAFVLKVENRSSKAIDGVALRVLLNGAQDRFAIVKGLQPYERRELDTLFIELGELDPLGADLNWEFRAELAGDTAPQDNVVRTKSIYLGDVVALPDAPMAGGPLGKRPMDEYTIYQLKPGERALFTDAGGLRYPYGSNWNNSSIKFKPSDASMAVRARIEYFDLDSTATMTVSRYDMPDEPGLGYPDSPNELEYTGRVETLPIEVQSMARDGGLVFHVETEVKPKPAAGWVIMVDEVPRVNLLGLLSVSLRAVGPGERGEVPLKVELANYGEAGLQDVRICWDTAYFDMSGDEPVEVRMGDCKMIDVKPGVSEYEIGKLTLPAFHIRDRISVYVDHSDDGDGADNHLVANGIYDNFPIPARTDAPLMQDGKGANVRMEFIPEGYIPLSMDSPDPLEVYYHEWNEVKLYKGYSTKITLTNDEELSNVDNVFVQLYLLKEGEEPIKCGGVEQIAKGSSVTVDLTAVRVGAYRARILIGSAEEQLGDPYFKNGRSGVDVHDLPLEIVEIKAKDLALESVTLVDQFGKPLNRYEKKDARLGNVNVKVTIRNNGTSTFKGNLTVKRQIGEQIEPAELIDLSIDGFKSESDLIVPFGLNLSSLGDHAVSVSIVDPDATGTEDNNVQEVEVTVWEPGSDGPYALTFRNLPDEIEEGAGYWVDLPDLDRKLLDKESATLEFWVRSGWPQNGVLFGTDESAESQFMVAVSSEKEFMGIPIPDDALFVRAGELIFYTRSGVVKPGEWVHLAILFEGMEHVSNRPKTGSVSVYANGEPVEVEVLSHLGNIQNLSAVMLCPFFSGSVDEVRLWGRALSQEDIKSNAMAGDLSSHPNTDDLVYRLSFEEGAGNGYLEASSGANFIWDSAPYGLIYSEDASALPDLLKPVQENGMWLSLKDEPLLLSVTIDGGAEALYESHRSGVKVQLPHGASLSGLSGSVRGIWPGMTYSVVGGTASVDAESGAITGLDLSEREVIVKIQGEVFGSTLSEEVTIVGENLPLIESDLLSLTVADPAAKWMDGTKEFDRPDGSIELKGTGEYAPGLMVTVKDYSVSADAKLLHKGQEVSKGADLSVDEPLLLTVKSDLDGREKHYVLSVRFGQSLEGKLKPYEGVYGDKPVALDLRASSGLPLSYTSSDVSVVNVVEGQLHFGRPGEAKVTVWQAGDARYTPSEKLTFDVSVKKAKAEVRPGFVKGVIPFGQRWGRYYVFSGLLGMDDEFTMPDMQELVKWTFYSTELDQEFSADAFLPVGRYEVRPGVTEVSTDRYDVTAQPSTVSVIKDEKVQSVVVEVKELDRETVVTGASVLVGDQLYVTDDRGRVFFGVEGGERVVLEVSKTGYSRRSVLYTADTALALGRVLVLLPANDKEGSVRYEVTPDAGMGAIVGENPQYGAYGTQSEWVYAMAKDGYQFEGWSSGGSDVRHRVLFGEDEQVVQARFKKMTCEYRYELGEGGEFVDGEKSVKVVSGAYGEAVPEIEAKSETDRAYFLGWSDGVKSAKRPAETFGTGQRSVTALYIPFGVKGEMEGFESSRIGTYPTGWSDRNEYANMGSGWSVREGEMYFFDADNPDGWPVGMMGKYCAADPVYSLTGGTGELYTKRYRVTASEDPEVSFHYLFGAGKNTDVKLQYQYGDGSGWKDMREWAADTSSSAMAATFERVELPAAPMADGWVQFRFVVVSTGFQAGGFAIDNFRFDAAATVPGFTVSYSVEPAGSGAVHLDSRPVDEQQVASGDWSQSVVAVPNGGKRFLYWKETLSSDPALPGESVTQDKSYTAVFGDADAVLVHFVATPAGAGRIEKKADNQPVSMLTVKRGMEIPEVVAVSETGYRFVGWNVPGKTQPELKGVLAQYDRTILASFEKGDAKASNSLTVTVFKKEKDAQGKDAEVLVSGAAVLVTRDGERKGFGTSDGKGQAKFELWEAGAYQVRVQAEGVMVEMDVEVKAGADNAVRVELKETTPLYEVTFVVTSDGEPVPGAEVRVMVDSVRKTGNDGKARFMLPAGPVSYSVTAEGYAGVNGATWRVSGDAKDQLVPVNLIGGIEIQFVVTDAELNVPLAGVNVWVDGHPYKTDVNGVVKVTLIPGSQLIYFAEGKGFVRSTAESFEVNREKTRYEIALAPVSYEVLFEVVDVADKKGLSGATLTNLTSGKTYRTGADGTVRILLRVGEHAFRVECDGYDYLGKHSVLVVDGSLTVSIALTRLSDGGGEGKSQSAVTVSLLDGVRVGPNPAKEALVVYGAKHLDRIEVLDAYGRLVRQADVLGADELRILLGGLTGGMYYLRLVSPDGESALVPVLVDR